MEQLELIIMQIIINSGAALSSAHQALEAAQNNELDQAEELMKEAKDKLLLAHEAQTTLIQNEADGQETPLSLLMVHAQDHLMTSMLAKDLIGKMIEMQMEINELKAKI